MKIGIVFFSLIKLFQGKAKPKRIPKKYILVSDDEVLQEQLANKLNSKVLLQNNTDTFSEEDIEIIFDQNYLDFKTIITALETNKNKNYTFKIRPASSHFVIGSNSSFDRGEVVVLQ